MLWRWLQTLTLSGRAARYASRVSFQPASAASPLSLCVLKYAVTCGTQVYYF